MDSCQFPTTRRDRAKDTGYKIARLAFPDSELNNLVEHTENFVQASWAILLCHYVRKEKVSFAVLGNLDAIDDTSPRSSDSLPDISVLQYALEPSQQFGEIHPQAQFRSTARELLESKINTAIYFHGHCSSSGDPSFDHFSSFKYSVRSQSIVSVVCVY